MTRRKQHKITNAYEAWWFLHYHPKFAIRDRIELQVKRRLSANERKRWQIVKDRGGNLWLESKNLRPRALDTNLAIYYTKVDSTGTVNEDRSKNINVECWLEFGGLEWGYHAEWEPKDGEREHTLKCHDPRLDCGAPTFDEALVKLANLVLKHYGNYKVERD